MTKILIATFLALGFSASPQISIERTSPAENQCVELEPEQMSCKASGQKCEDAEECCSRQCRKDNGRCG